MQSAKYIANICDCHRSFLFVFALIFAVFFALCKKYRNFFRFFFALCKMYRKYLQYFLRRANNTVKICAFFPKNIFAGLYELPKKNANFCVIICASLTKNTVIICGNVHRAKKYRRFTPQILLLTQNITAQCTLCTLLRLHSMKIREAITYKLCSFF